jgi:hypothetical protein
MNKSGEAMNIELLENNINNNIIERDTLYIDEEMKNYITTEEGQKIKADIELLQEMGYEKKMINKVYILLQPPTLDRAIEYMSEINGVYQHNFFENHNPKKDKNLCFICNRPKNVHFDYIPDILLNQDDNDNFNEKNNFDDDFDNKNLVGHECNICYEDVPEDERKMNVLPCGHLCCTQCWLNYFKTAISEAKVEEIKCIDFSCKDIISEEFILNHINNDQILKDKYKRFKTRADIIKDKNKKQCPHPDCESYLEKSISKYVKCKNGHEYCFECLKPPHGKVSCENNIDKEFMKWKKHRRIKRCPKCKIFIEKNEGCNHMTCKSCKHQWCWLCEQPYTYEHFSTGKCKGNQYSRANNLCLANFCCCTVRTFFPCYFQEIVGVYPIEYISLRYLAIFGLWIFGFFFFVGVSFAIYNDQYRIKNGFVFFGFVTTICLWICFQPLFACLVTPFALISLFYHNFLDVILKFLNIGH